MSELNLIPYHIKQKRMVKLALFQGVLVVVLVLAVLGTAAYLPYAKLRKLQTEEANLKLTVEKDRVIRVENERLKTETASLKNFVDKVEMLQASKASVYPVLKNLEKYIPSEIVITSLNYGNGTINVNATCNKEYNYINELLANLQESKEFSSSQVINITRNDKAPEWTFTLIITDVKGEAK
jgi:Tfp pilus assembly protein PilN